MKRNYESPQVEVVEIELEGSILYGSGDATLPGVNDGGFAV